MYVLSGVRLDTWVRRWLGFTLLITGILFGPAPYFPSAWAQDPAVSQEPAEIQQAVNREPSADKPVAVNKPASNERASNEPTTGEKATGEKVTEPYVAATGLLPQSVAGMVRIPHVPRFRKAWEKTHLGRLLDEPSMQPFVDAQRERVESYLESIDNKIGIRLEDLAEIASGEVVVSWLPFEKDKRRPFAICVVADIRGLRAEADKAMDTIDQDLKEGGWTRTDTTHRGQAVRIYNTKPKPGQLKVEQIAITISDVRIVAADRDSVVTDLLDAIAGEPKGPPLQELEEFVSVLKRSSQAIRGPVQKGGATIAAEWFAHPFSMSRVLREAFEIDRGNQVDVVKLLENQGFDVIKGVGGIFALAGEKYDFLHRGFVLAKQSELKKAARMLQFENQPIEAIPSWVHQEVASFNRVNLRIEEAFWASESLVNEAFGDEIFRDIIEGIRDDEDGPQIDVEANVLPNLDDQIILLTDNTAPAEVNSERMLLAIRVKDANAIEAAIRKAMEVEPDASKLEALPGVEIWQVQRSESEDDFDAELFGDLELDFGEEEEETAPPLLEHWAIALVPAGKGSPSPYLIFSSHPEFLVATAKRIRNGVPEGAADLASVEEIRKVTASVKALGGMQPAYDRVVRMKLSLRAKYKLLRQGKLKDSDTLLASVYRRLFEDEDGEEAEPLNAEKLPPLKEIEKFLPDGGSFVETTKDGWAITGFLLK